MTTRFPHAYVINVLSDDRPGIVASVSTAVDRLGGNIGVINDKTTGVRLIPVPGAKAGDRAEFGGLFGQASVLDVRCKGSSSAFVRLGGRIPAPIQSLGN